MKKLCVVCFVFHNRRYGEFEYLAYIPFYIYTVLKAYPDYAVRIYTDCDLPFEISEQLRLLEGMGEFHVVENISVPGFKPGKDPNGDLRKSIRWLFYDDAFEQFETIYIGDIDILIGKETPGIYEAHLKHCETLGLPYSNIVRPQPVETKRDIFHLAACWRNGFGVGQILRYLHMDISHWYKLSGRQHFFKTEEYYSKIRPHIPAVVQELNLAAKGKSPYWNMCAIPFNEHVLYRLVEMSGLSLPPRLSEEEFRIGMRGPYDPSKLWYYPFHGIHLVDFRGGAASSGSEKSPGKFQYSQGYIDAYRQFAYNLKTDGRLRELVDSSGPFIANTLERMHSAFAASGHDAEISP